MLSIPNQVVREQLYNYLIEIYNDTAEPIAITLVFR